MPTLTLIIHGWSDTSKSFVDIARFLSNSGHEVVNIYLADYKSMHDEISLQDVGQAMQEALRDHALSLEPKSFNAVVHSTGGIVVREFLKQHCRDAKGNFDPSLSPISNLLMLAPANFGSPLAKMGKSMVGRLFKGWKWDGPFETGKRLLHALELASPITYALSKEDLFNPSFPIFKKANVLTTVLVGSNAYESAMRRLLHENGTDGTVRVATANLNARHLKIDFADPSQPRTEWLEPNYGEIAFAVLDRNHTTIHKDVAANREEWRDLVLKALSVKESEYDDHLKECREVTRDTFKTGQGAHRIEKRKRFHEYMNVVFYVHDQYGESIPDYFIEFYQDLEDEDEKVMTKIHSEILESVKVNSTDSSYRSLFFDVTDLQNELDEHPDMSVDMSIVAADLSDDIGYRNPPEVSTAGIRVFGKDRKDFFLPNQTLFVEVCLYRQAGPEVFRIKNAKV